MKTYRVKLELKNRWRMPHHEAIRMQQVERKPKGGYVYMKTYQPQVDAKDPADARKKVNKWLIKNGLSNTWEVGGVFEHEFYTTSPTDPRRKRTQNTTTAKMRRMR